MRGEAGFNGTAHHFTPMNFKTIRNHVCSVPGQAASHGDGEPLFMSRSEYARELRPLLPSRAFTPALGKLWRIAGHLAIVCGGYMAIRFMGGPVLYPIYTLLVGHSLACLAFLAHELSHNAIVRHGFLKRTMEMLLWGLNLLPPTLWIRIHNQTHHQKPNSLHDPDRTFVQAENSRAIQLFMRVFVPNRRTIRWLPSVFFTFVTYIARYTLTAFYPPNTIPTPVIATARPAFVTGDRAASLSSFS